MYLEEMDSTTQKKIDRTGNTMIFILSGFLLIAGITLLIKGISLHISISLSTYAVIALIAFTGGNLVLYILDRRIWKEK